MALIRVTRCLDVVEDTKDDEVILNCSQIVMIHPDPHKPSRGVWIQLVTGDPILVKMSFEEIWTFVQRET